MYKHKSHNLYLHDDTELAPILGENTISRDTVHEWPGSSVHQVVTALRQIGLWTSS